MTSPSRTRALVATAVAVSNARISTRKNALFQGFLVALQHDQSTRLPHVLQTDAGLLRRQESRSGLRPLDEDGGVVVLLQVSPLRVRHALEAIEVEMGDVNPPFVPVADRVGRAGHRALDAERPRSAAHERRLAGAELTLDQNDVTGSQPGGEARGDALGLLGRVRLELGHGRSVVARPG